MYFRVAADSEVKEGCQTFLREIVEIFDAQKETLNFSLNKRDVSSIIHDLFENSVSITVRKVKRNISRIKIVEFQNLTVQQQQIQIEKELFHNELFDQG